MNGSNLRSLIISFALTAVLGCGEPRRHGIDNDRDASPVTQDGRVATAGGNGTGAGGMGDAAGELPAGGSTGSAGTPESGGQDGGPAAIDGHSTVDDADAASPDIPSGSPPPGYSTDAADSSPSPDAVNPANPGPPGPRPCSDGCALGDRRCQVGRLEQCSNVDGCPAWTALMPCPAPANGAATCDDNTTCSFRCNAGFNKCGNQCRADSVDSCGNTCSRCTAPTNATARCEGGRCEFSCNGGRLNCDGTCIASSQPCNGDCRGLRRCGNTCLDGNCCDDSECAGPFACRTNRCRSSCTSNADCKSGLICAEGNCVRCTPNQICGQSQNSCQELRTICTRDGERCEPRNKSNGTNCGNGPRCINDSQIKLQDKCMGGECNSPTMNCPNGQKCAANGNNPRCEPTCNSECTPGERRCKPNDDFTIQLCVRVQTCGIWQDDAGCTLTPEGTPQFRCRQNGNSAQCDCVQTCEADLL